MPEQDLHSEIELVQAIAQGAKTATAVGASIDMAAHDGQSLEYAIQTGVITAADVATNLMTFQPQEADDVAGSPGAWTDVSSDETLGVPPVIDLDDATQDNTVLRVGSIGKKQWQRLRGVETGAFDGIFGAVAVIGHNRSEPVADQSA